MDCRGWASLSVTISLSLLKLMSIESVMPSNHLILCHPFLLLPSIFPSIRVFSNESTLGIRWPKHWSFGTILPMNIQGWFLLRLTGFISLLSKGLSRIFSSTTILKHQFFSAQPSLCSNSHPYMTTGKTIGLTRWTFVTKVMSLLFNMLSRFVIAFLPRSKHLLSSCLQSPSTVILGPKKIKSVTVSIFSPSICHEVMGLDAMILVFWMLNFKPAFPLFFSPSSRGSLVPLHFLPLWWCYHLHIWGYMHTCK